MLVLGRKQGESIRIDEGIVVTIVGIQGNRVRLGINAPENVRVVRSELEVRSPESADSSAGRPVKAQTVGRSVA
jgi:carbon storage regulator